MKQLCAFLCKGALHLPTAGYSHSGRLYNGGSLSPSLMFISPPDAKNDYHCPSFPPISRWTNSESVWMGQMTSLHWPIPIILLFWNRNIPGAKYQVPCGYCSLDLKISSRCQKLYRFHWASETALLLSPSNILRVEAICLVSIINSY